MKKLFNQKLQEAQNSNYHIGICVRVLCGDKFLLLRRAPTDSGPGILENAGGSVDEGESLEEAACRELFEEAGITISTEQLEPLHIFEFHNKEKDVHNIKFAFKVSLKDEPSIILSDDHDHYIFMTQDEVEVLPRQGKDENFVIWQDHHTLLTM